MKELFDISHEERIVLFRLYNYNPNKLKESFYFTNNVGIQFDKQEYTPVACAISGIEYTGEGSSPRPRLQVSDTSYVISNLLDYYGGIVGAYVDVKTTLKRFLDTEPTADVNAIITSDTYIVSQKILEIPGKEIEFELSAAGDFVDESFPGRSCITRCPWKYRGSECGYTASKYFDINDNRVRNEEEDECGKTIRSCEKRFGTDVDLPFGGFPGLITRSS